jgi:Cupredoxin-like domain
VKRPLCARLSPLAALALATAAGGCARDDSGSAPRGRATVSMTEYRLSPQTLRAAPGRLRLTVVNRGREAHRLAIGEARSALRVTPLIAPGRRAVLEVTLPAGTYRMFSPVGSDDTLGLEGEVVIGDGTGAGP